MTDKTPEKKTADNLNTPAEPDKETPAKSYSASQKKGLPQAAALKERFRAGSIPLQTDFADLIDMANMGRQAVGGAEGQTGPANGFTLSTAGRLELKSSNGIKVDTDGLSVDPGDGMQINKQGVSIRLAANSGLSADKNGLKIVPEQMFQKGMVMMFAGKESEMPKGWALCDGNGGRPDLRDRFILGSTGFTNINENNNKKVTGGNVNKTFLVSTNNAEPNINVTVDGYILSTEQIPEHNHLGGMRSSIYGSVKDGSFNTKLTAEYGYKDNGKSPSNGYPLASIKVFTNGHSISCTQLYTSKTGGTKPHDHKASAKQNAHNHNVNVVPPYYILAFIIKL